jgi:hypothetical protein
MASCLKSLPQGFVVWQLLGCLANTPIDVEGKYSGGAYEGKTDFGIDHALWAFVPARNRGDAK